MCDNLHPLAAFFIQHPIRHHELIAIRKSHLNLMRPKRNRPSHHGYGLAVQWMMRIVNSEQNMRSV
jgi:hypothetical protein